MWQEVGNLCLSIAWASANGSESEPKGVSPLWIIWRNFPCFNGTWLSRYYFTGLVGLSLWKLPGSCFNFKTVFPCIWIPMAVKPQALESVLIPHRTLKPWDLCVYDVSDIWRAYRQYYCKGTCQILKRYSDLNYRCGKVKTSRYLTIGPFSHGASFNIKISSI